MKKVFLLSLFIFGFAGALTVYAQDASITGGFCSGPGIGMGSVSGIINWASCALMNIIIPFLFALATAGFIYGLIKFFLNPDSKDKKEEGKKFIIWGLVALFIMVSMWGIVKVFSNTFEVENTIPRLPTYSE